MNRTQVATTTAPAEALRKADFDWELLSFFSLFVVVETVLCPPFALPKIGRNVATAAG